MTCPHCDDAKQHRLGGNRINAGCEGCIAREIARGPQFHEARKTGRMTPAYKAVLKFYFKDAWQRGHQLVKGWT